jgi:hypothetical protein
MSYVPVGLNLTQAKAARLMAGHSVRLGKEAHGGGLHVHMTRRQADKWTRHSRTGKGMLLRMSTAQIRHHKRGARVATSETAEVPTSQSGGRVAKRRRTTTTVGTGGGAPPIESQTKQLKRSAQHPRLTTFEKDPLPGEHTAVVQ